MPIRIDPNKIDTPHYVHTKTGDGLELYVFTGIVIVGLSGHSNDWRREQVEFAISVPDLPSRKVFKLSHWAPFVTINAYENTDDDDSIRGAAVDRFRILNPSAEGSSFVVQSDVAMRSPETTLHRLGFNVTVVGTYVDGPEPPI